MTAEPELRLDGAGPLYQQIIRAIARPIQAGAWPPGARIPSEKGLCDLFGASRMTVNRALTSLAEDGLITRHRRTGSFVAPKGRERAVFEIWDVQTEVEAAGEVYRFEPLTIEVLSPHAVAGRVPDALVGPCLWVVGRHLAGDQPVQFERRLVDLATAPDAERAVREGHPPGQWLLRHVRWSQAEHAIRAEAAGGEVARFLGVADGAACLVVERRTWREARLVTWAELWSEAGTRRLVGRFAPGPRLGA